MSPTYAAVYTVTLPRAKQVVDAFHLVQLANRALDEIRRRVQREHTGRRGRAKDPLFRARRILAGEERLNPAARERLASLLTLGDPGGEVAIAHRVKERVREFYQCGDKDTARGVLAELVEHCRRSSMPKVGYGFRNFRNYRVRALLYAGKPNWRLLGSIVVQ